MFSFTWLSFTGTGMLIAAIISGLVMGFTPGKMVAEYGRTIRICAYSLITISAMLAIGTLTRLSASTRRSASPSPAPGFYIRSSARCSAGSASR